MKTHHAIQIQLSSVCISHRYIQTDTHKNSKYFRNLPEKCAEECAANIVVFFQVCIFVAFVFRSGGGSSATASDCLHLSPLQRHKTESIEAPFIGARQLSTTFLSETENERKQVKFTAEFSHCCLKTCFAPKNAFLVRMYQSELRAPCLPQ